VTITHRVIHSVDEKCLISLPLNGQWAYHPGLIKSRNWALGTIDKQAFPASSKD